MQPALQPAEAVQQDVMKTPGKGLPHTRKRLADNRPRPAPPSPPRATPGHAAPAIYWLCLLPVAY